MVASKFVNYSLKQMELFFDVEIFPQWKKENPLSDLAPSTKWMRRKGYRAWFENYNKKANLFEFFISKNLQLQKHQHWIYDKSFFIQLWKNKIKPLRINQGYNENYAPSQKWLKENGFGGLRKAVFRYSKDYKNLRNFWMDLKNLLSRLGPGGLSILKEDY